MTQKGLATPLAATHSTMITDSALREGGKSRSMAGMPAKAALNVADRLVALTGSAAGRRVSVRKSRLMVAPVL